jgi:predicted ABC-type ATPase
MVFKNDSIQRTKELLQEVATITDGKISELALKYIKSNKRELIRVNLPVQEKGIHAFFMAGSPGAGKTEFVRISFEENINIIEADRIRKNIPYYKGSNSHLFQRASSKAVNILLDYCFKHHLPFVLDGNFAVKKNQDENINRCLSRDYQTTVLFVYRAPEQALEFTELREEKEGRKISKEVFFEKSLGAIETTRTFIGYHDSVNVDFIDLERDEIITNVSDTDFDLRTNPLQKFCLARQGY